MKQLFPTLLIVIGGVMSFDTASAASVEQLSTIDFSLRFPSALSRFSAAADVAAVGGASAGSPYASGVNPASIVWRPDPGSHFSFSPQFSRITFARNPDLSVATGTFAFNTSSRSGLQASIADIKTDDTSQPSAFDVEGNYFQTQWSMKVSPYLAIGGALTYSDFDTQAIDSGLLVADGNSKTLGGRVGLLWAATSKLLVGAVVDYSSADPETDYLDINCMCYVHAKDAHKTRMFRAGLTYEYKPFSSIYADFLAGTFRNSFQSMTSKTVIIGIEHQFLPWLYGRAGASHDTRGFDGKTLGIGVVPSRNISVDLAWQRDMFPELLPEFGKSEVLNLSLNISL